MQIAFGFGQDEEIRWVRERLRKHFGNAGAPRLRTPVGQLVKSIISSRTKDEVSRATAERLETRYPNWSLLAHAPLDEIHSVIKDVTFPENKACYLHDALRIVTVRCQDFDLTFLKQMTVDQALDWLERLPGVGRKVAASVLNFSTLKMPAFVIDTHILRLLRRFGLVRRTADIASAYDSVMAMVPEWNAEEFAEMHMLMKRLGQTVCQSNQAFCEHCPIGERCRTVRVSAFPPA